MFVNRANPMLEAGVNISTLPVGVGVDSSLRMLAWGCRRSKPGGSCPSLHPSLFRAGGCAQILYNFESKIQRHIFRIMVSASVGVVVGVTLVGRVLGYGTLEFIFAKT